MAIRPYCFGSQRFRVHVMQLFHRAPRVEVDFSSCIQRTVGNRVGTPLGDGVIDHQFLSMCDTAESRTCPRMSYLRPERMQQCAQYRGYVRYELPSLSPPELPPLTPPHTPTFTTNEETPGRTSTEGFCLRKQGDLNPRRCDPRWFSRPVHSAALPYFQRQHHNRIPP